MGGAINLGLGVGLDPLFAEAESVELFSSPSLRSAVRGA